MTRGGCLRPRALAGASIALSWLAVVIALVACGSDDIIYAGADGSVKDGASKDGASSTNDAATSPLDSSSDDETTPSFDAGPPQKCDPDGAACDTTQGLGCCVTGSASDPFCTDQTSAQTSCSSGIFVYCLTNDPNSDSVCCWNSGTTAGGFTSYASDCGPGRPQACTDTSQCPGTTCNLVTCKGFTFGACGVTPVCPP